jgi:hypothetical protein
MVKQGNIDEGRFVRALAAELEQEIRDIDKLGRLSWRPLSCRMLALNGHRAAVATCLLSGQQRTSFARSEYFAF